MFMRQQGNSLPQFPHWQNKKLKTLNYLIINYFQQARKVVQRKFVCVHFFSELWVSELKSSFPCKIILYKDMMYKTLISIYLFIIHSRKLIIMAFHSLCPTYFIFILHLRQRGLLLTSLVDTARNEGMISMCSTIKSETHSVV